MSGPHPGRVIRRLGEPPIASAGLGTTVQRDSTVVLVCNPRPTDPGETDPSGTTPPDDTAPPDDTTPPDDSQTPSS